MGSAPAPMVSIAVSMTPMSVDTLLDGTENAGATFELQVQMLRASTPDDGKMLQVDPIFLADVVENAILLADAVENQSMGRQISIADAEQQATTLDDTLSRVKTSVPQ